MMYGLCVNLNFCQFYGLCMSQEIFQKPPSSLEDPPGNTFYPLGDANWIPHFYNLWRFSWCLGSLNWILMYDCMNFDVIECLGTMGVVIGSVERE